MMFSDRLAKLGKGQSVSCYQLADDTTNILNVFISKQGVENKNLVIDNNKYKLSSKLNQYMYSEMIQVSSKYAVARIDNSFSIIDISGEDNGT